MKSAIILCAAAIALSACGGGGGGGSGGGSGGGADKGLTAEQQAASDTCANTPKNSGFDGRYIVNEKGSNGSCTTGCKIFSSPEEFCSRILDDEFNNNCGREGREETHDRYCN